MKKRLLLFAAVLSASANYMFAQNNTVYSDDNNITYTYSANSDVTITAQGQSSLDSENNRENIIWGSTLSIDYVSFTRVANRNRDIKLTVSDINDYSILPSQLQSFSRAVVSGEDLTNEDLNTTLSSFATDNRLNFPRSQRNNLPPSEMYYKIRQNTNAEKAAYATYQNACEKARSRGLYVYTGAELLEEGVDFDLYNMQINEGLYYIDAPDAVNVILINATTGNWKEGTTYLNCTDNFIPTYIGSNIPLPTTTASDEDSKVGIVSGLVDLARFNNIVAGKAFLNYDFTGTTIVGSINSSSVGANRLAYFADGISAEGVNIINGTNCENYELADDGTEIKVYKPFNAKNIDYSRNITAGNYYTITVPFNFQNKSDYFNRTSTFTSCNIEGDKTKVKFTLAEWEANMPMLCKANTTTSVLSLSSTQGIEVKKSIAKSWSGDELSSEPAKFNGNYEAKPKAELADAWIVGLSGTFGRMPVNSTQLKPGRAYITLDKYSAAKLDNAIVEFIDEDGTVEVLEVNGETTGIDGIDGIADSSNEVVASQFVTLDGKVSTTPVKGLNIVKSVNKNGQITTKKVVY